MGKTSLALNIAQNAAIRFHKTVGIFSLEMSKEQLVDRLFASMLGVDSWKLQRGKLDDSDFQNMGPIMDELNKANILHRRLDGLVAPRAPRQGAPAPDGARVGSPDRRLPPADEHWQPSYAGNRVQEISEISRSLKQIGRELHGCQSSRSRSSPAP